MVNRKVPGREWPQTGGNVTFCGPCFSTFAGGGVRPWPAGRPETSPQLKTRASLSASDNSALASLDGGVQSLLLYGQSLPCI